MRSGLLIILLLFFFNCSSNLLDFTNPVVNAVTPQPGAFFIPTNTAVTINFSESMNRSSVRSSTILSKNSEDIFCVFSWQQHKLFLEPEQGLETGKKYNVILNTDVKDKAGNHLRQEYTFCFYTRGPMGRLRLISNNIKQYYNFIQQKTNLVFYFSRELDPHQEKNNIFTISPALNGECSIVSNRFIFHPCFSYENNTRYKVLIAARCCSRGYTPLLKNQTFYFHTGTGESGAKLKGISTARRKISNTNYLCFSNMENTLRTDSKLVFIFSGCMNLTTAGAGISFTPDISGYFSRPLSNILQYNPAAKLVYGIRYKIKLTPELKSCNDVPLNKETNFYLKTENRLDSRLVLNTLSKFNGTRLTSSNINNINTASNHTSLLYLTFTHPAQSAMDITTVYDNLVFSLQNGSNASYSGQLAAVSKNNNVLKLKIINIAPGNHYQLKIQGGESGLMNINGNHLENDHYFIIRYK